MQVVSTNLGHKRTIIWDGKEVLTGIFKYPVYEPIHLHFTDVVNDNVIDRRYHGGVDKACYLYSADNYTYWKEQLPGLDWQFGMFGENLTIAGLNEASVNIGNIYKLGSAIVQVTQPRQPCFKLGVRLNTNKAVKMFVQAEMPGVYLRIIEPGAVKTGDSMVLVQQMAKNYTLREIFQFLYHPFEHREQIKKAIDIPELAESCRNDLLKHLNQFK